MLGRVIPRGPPSSMGRPRRRLLHRPYLLSQPLLAHAHIQIIGGDVYDIERRESHTHDGAEQRRSSQPGHRQRRNAGRSNCRNAQNRQLDRENRKNQQDELRQPIRQQPAQHAPAHSARPACCCAPTTTGRRHFRPPWQARSGSSSRPLYHRQDKADQGKRRAHQPPGRPRPAGHRWPWRGRSTPKQQAVQSRYQRQQANPAHRLADEVRAPQRRPARVSGCDTTGATPALGQAPARWSRGSAHRPSRGKRTYAIRRSRWRITRAARRR